MAEEDRGEQSLPHSLFKWRVLQVEKKELTNLSCCDTNWYKKDKLIAFALFCLIWQYDDVIANVEEGGWTYLPMRLQELIVVVVLAYCTALIFSVKYGSFCCLPLPVGTSTSYGGFMALENKPNEDLLSERSVEVQTNRADYGKQTRLLKERHDKEMKRLNRQAKGLRRMLAAQWKEAKKNLEEKDKLLSDLQQKLLPLEKESADHLLEKEIIDNKLKEERRRYTDLMTRIDRVNQQLEGLISCPVSSQRPNHDNKYYDKQTEILNKIPFSNQPPDLSNQLEQRVMQQADFTKNTLSTLLLKEDQCIVGDFAIDSNNDLQLSNLSKRLRGKETTKNVTSETELLAGGCKYNNNDAAVYNKFETKDAVEHTFKGDGEPLSTEKASVLNLSKNSSDIDTTPGDLFGLPDAKLQNERNSNSEITGVTLKDLESDIEQNGEGTENNVHDQESKVFQKRQSPPLEGAVGGNTSSEAIAMDIVHPNYKYQEQEGLADSDTNSSNFETVSRSNKRNKKKGKSTRNIQQTGNETETTVNAVDFRRSLLEQTHLNRNINVNMNRGQTLNDGTGGYFPQGPYWQPSVLQFNGYDRAAQQQYQFQSYRNHQQQMFLNSMGRNTGWYNHYNGIGRMDRM